MNERYLFRGKRKDNGEWMQGRLLADDVIVPNGQEFEMEGGEIYTEEFKAYEVIPETVGQCTGLKDKHGNLIFDEDILKGFHYPFLSDGCHNYFAEVVLFDNCPAFGIYTLKNPLSKVRGISEGNTDFMEDWNPSEWEVTGNKWDNPELLEVSK